MIGQKFNRVTVVGPQVRMNGWADKRWTCVCDCGKTMFVTGTKLKNGSSKSCGCLSVEKTIERSKTHGMSKTKVFWIWNSMHQRCKNPNNKNYERYKHFAPPSRWDSFENFYEDMGDPPEGMSIDRINNLEGYSKENCRWATPAEQTGNTKRSISVTVAGKRVCLKEACAITGTPYHRTVKRVRKGSDVYQELGIEKPRPKDAP